MKKYRLIKKAPRGALLCACTPMLETPAKQVFSPEDREVLVQMCRILLRNKLTGLSSNQIGATISAFITHVPGDIIRVFANPDVQILDYNEELVSEGCGSYPNANASRYRHRHLQIWYQNLCGVPGSLDTYDICLSESTSKALSYQIQHEMEHLAGTNVRHQQMELADSDLHPELMDALEHF